MHLPEATAGTPVNVTLTPAEQLVACQIGCLRQVSSLTAGLRDRHGAAKRDGWSLHIEGAAGELAAAKAVGRYWPASVNTFRGEADIPGAEVRTRSRDYYDLIVREDDEDDKAFVLVVGSMPNYRVCGWIAAGDGKRPEFLRTYGDRPPAWFVPQSALHPLTTLPTKDAP